MTLLILGMILWWAVHLFPVLAKDKRVAVGAKVGAGPSKGLAALAIIASVVLMVKGYQTAEVQSLWYPPTFMVHINNLLMLIAIFLFIAGNMPSPIRRKIRHPQLAGTKTWAIAHLLVNGDLASIILFGGILAWAVIAMIGANRRDGPRGELPPVDGRGLVVHIAVTVILFAAITYVHGFLLEVWPFPG